MSKIGLLIKGADLLELEMMRWTGGDPFICDALDCARFAKPCDRSCACFLEAQRHHIAECKAWMKKARSLGNAIEASEQPNP